MAQPYYGYPYPASAPLPLPPPIPIVSPRFCLPYPVDLSIVRKVMTITDGNFVVTDVNGNLMFKVKKPIFAFHDKRVLVDSYGAPVVTLREKIMSLRDRWQVFIGDSTDRRDLLFTVKKSRLIQLKTELDVFLANNRSERRCDFRVKGSWFERSCVVYAGESNTIVAQMHKKQTIQSIFMGKDNFSVTVYPNMDHAFIISLIVILDDVNKERSSTDAQTGSSR